MGNLQVLKVYRNDWKQLKLLLVEKGKKPQLNTGKPFINKPSVVYSTHVQDYGWLNPVEDGKLSGTSRTSETFRRIKISLKDSPYTGNIVYSTHVQDYGWLNSVSNGDVSGTAGQGKAFGSY